MKKTWLEPRWGCHSSGDMLSPDVRVPTSPHDTTWAPLTHGCHLAASENHWLFLTTHYPALFDQTLGFVCLKQWTHPEWFSTLCNMLLLCRSFTSFIHSTHNLLNACFVLGTQRWPGQSPVLPTEITLPWADLIYQASNCRVSDPQTKVHLFPSLVSFP